MTETFGQKFAREVRANRLARVQTEFRTLITSATAAAWQPDGDPQFPPTGKRRLYVRDLLRPPAPTETRVVSYVEETTFEGSAGATATSEAAAKAETELAFAGGELKAEKITAWVPITGEVRDDVPGLAAYVDGRLGEHLGLAEDDQLLNGTGTSPYLKGFLSWPNIQTQAAVTDDLPATIGQAISKVENVGTVVDGVVVNPLDYWTARNERHANGLDDDGAFDAQGNIWGVPTVRTNKIAAGTALVGAFSFGATLRERSPVTVRLSNEHDDYFIKNKSAVVAEVVEALTVHRQSYFCSATITFS